MLCTPEQCALCQLIPGSDFCLRRQARRCVELSERALSEGIRAALKDLSLNLMDEARVIEVEDAVQLSCV
jgi:hypothetical protein